MKMTENSMNANKSEITSILKSNSSNVKTNIVRLDKILTA